MVLLIHISLLQRTSRPLLLTGEEIGISAVNDGTGALSITTKGTVTGYDGDGIDAVNSINGTSLTVYAADVYGYENGISATNNGK